MRILYLITARKGSKGLPNKNIKSFCGKPLIKHSIDFAINHCNNIEDICVSTDDRKIIKLSKHLGLKVKFERPKELSNDTATSFDVIKHAISFYDLSIYDALILLQPTSPIRSNDDLYNVINVFNTECDMVVTVKVSKDNPYFNIFEENESGYLIKSKELKSISTNRQGMPNVYVLNGSIYMINIKSILKYNAFSKFNKIIKVIMPQERSIDIDNKFDWDLAKIYYKQQIKNNVQKYSH